MTDLDSATRDFFDGIFEEVLASAPPSVRDLIETLPVVVEDHPDESIQQELGINADEICGLHSGVPLTERSVEDSGVLPDVVYLYRLGIISAANDKMTEEEKNS
ncbi:MAG: metallopeptidase family protein, partial [Phycisphaerales bacterium]|nr:metallopeptidase family protein [Phycisphaerales bacterium]